MKKAFAGIHFAIGMCAVFSLFLAATPLVSVANAQQDIATDPAATSKNEKTAFDVEIWLKSFDVVWQTVKKTHWDKELVGEKWDEAKEKYRPLVAAATNPKEARKPINDLLNSLEQSHFGIIPSETYKEMAEADEQNAGGDGWSGLSIRLIEDQLVVTKVRAGSPARKAGVETGWIVTSIGKKSHDEIIEQTTKIAEHSVMRTETLIGLACDGRTSGKIGSELAIEFLDHGNQPHSLRLEFTEGPGRKAKFGNLPSILVEFRSESKDDIGYIAFTSFLDAPRLIAQYEKAIDDHRDKRGLVIDLRGNRGGMVLLVNGMCGWLVTDKAPIGEMNMAGTPVRLALNPRKHRYDKPVAVLIDECSISAAEIMSGGLKDLGRARVFGSTTAGLVLPSTVSKLPNGDGFQYAIASYKSASGKVLEGVGVVPDQAVALNRENLKYDRDPVFDAAEQWLLDQAESNQTENSDK